MKLRKGLLMCATATFLLSACSSSQSNKDNIVIADFEGDTYGDWKVEGDAFGKGPSKQASPGQQPIEGYKGSGFANSYNEQGDDARGVLTSPSFKIEKDYINFLIGGGKSVDTYIELIVDGKSVLRSTSLFESETLQPLSWDVKPYKGKDAIIKIVDLQRGPWGHIVVDQIEQSNTASSDIIVNYTMDFKVDKNYILVPIEEKAPELRVSISVDGVPTSSAFSFIRLAENKVDYFMPIEVAEYKGKSLKLCFDQVKETYVGLKDIKQSDVYDFKYDETFRPVYHFSPKYGWTNDPNGMVYNNGTYHLFYQHNPYGSMWGNMTWGHATTTDLTTWKHEPIAIRPDSIGAIFSGSAVVDKNNTAGFGKDAIVAIYTSAGRTQTQSLSYSLDGGRTFTSYNHNPVLVDPNYIDFRDPKVFWHEGSKQWIMSLATTQVITFYSSPNLKEWTKLSNFGEGIGDHGGVWECPDLFPLTIDGQTKWVLLVSINPGGPNGGSATQYFIGSFDGKTFKADDLPYPLWIDYGRDNYAGVTWADAPNNRRVFLGWMSNWDYTNYAPTVNFRNGMTIPRELTLGNNGKHTVLRSAPVKEVDKLRKETIALTTPIAVDKTYSVESLLAKNEGAYEIEMTIKPQNATKISFELSNTKNEKIVFNIDLASENLSVDRSTSGIINFADNFASNDIKSPLVKKDSYTIRLLVDKASTELFVNNGDLVQTNTVFPNEPYNKLTFNSDNAISVEGLKVYNLK